jgi:hypothetical protein
MDEIWQRHKTFILQCVVGGLIFLIALAVKSGMYGDVEILQGANARLKTERLDDLKNGRAPSKSSIAAQQAKAETGVAQIKRLADSVASRESGIAYVRENLTWALGNIGKPDEVDSYVTLYQQLQQTCLSNLQGAARDELVGKAARLGKSVDETMGINAGVAPEQVPAAIHGLAIVTDVVSRALAHEGITSITDIKISQHSRRGRSQSAEASFVKTFPVSMSIRGAPEAVATLLDELNWDDNAMKRFTVFGSIDSIQRDRPDADDVTATVTLLGLQFHGIGAQGAQPGGDE